MGKRRSSRRRRKWQQQRLHDKLHSVWELDRLIDGYKRVVRNIYSSREYYRRALDCLSHFHNNRVEPRKISLRADLRGFFNVILTLGIRDHSRLEFWSYFYQLLRHHTHNFAHGLTLAAMGYHFRQVTEKYTQ